ncbi:MAG: hypothetical protein C0500_10645 [Sphingobium sp.]|nr:hypothetical protein [Sphingobium sp.]
MTRFKITGLDAAPFAELYGLSDAALAVRGVERMTVSAKPGFPCRITLEDADLVDGRDLPTLIDRLFADSQVAFLHAHNAKRGCFAARIDRG